MKRVTVSIPEEALSRLREIAEVEYRPPRDQAGYLLVDAIRERYERMEAEAVARRRAQREAEGQQP